VGNGFSALQAERTPALEQSTARHSKAIPATACLLFIVVPPCDIYCLN
jgi:hypothetical protein